MMQKELIKIFMIMSNWKKNLWSPCFIQKYFSTVRVNYVNVDFGDTLLSVRLGSLELRAPKSCVFLR